MSHEDSQIMKVLETIADRLIDMHLANQRQFAETNSELASVQRKLDALMAVKADDQLSLFDMVKAAAPAPVAVVPNEDEAMPVLASCTQCDTKAYTEAGIEDFFGWRKMEDGKTIRQSWCRECRSSGKHKTEPVVEPVIVQDEPSPRKNVRLRMPPEVRALSQGATKLAREGQALIKQAMDNASANSGRMSLDDKKLLDAGTVKMTESKKLQSQYNSQRERITYPNGRK